MADYSAQISDSLVFRKAGIADIEPISFILRMAVARMLAEGKQQWDENYPNEKHIRSDIESGVGFVLENSGNIIAYGAVVFTGEPAYTHLDGTWLSNGKYVVVHRLAVSQHIRGNGIGRTFMLAVEDFARSIGVRSFKIDTNFDNFAMLRLLDRLRFTYCGEIQYERGTRRAFEKLI